MVRLIQTKWKGMVSQPGQRPMAARFATAKAPQASSTRLCRSDSIARIPHRLDRRLRPELLPDPPHADLDHVRPGIEVVSPDVGEQALAADDLARVLEQVVEQ